MSKDRDCIVNDCPYPGRNQLGIRCRVAHDGASPFPNKKRTDAIFSIETDAFLCDKHALSGGTLALMFEPDSSEEVKIEVLADRPVEARSKHIKQPDEISA
ncbi:MAG TPA: hypothetical protein VH297_10670 [Gaiellaceae bacterium]|jgi:hypothetical protein